MALKLTYIDERGLERSDYSVEENFIDQQDKLEWIAGYQRDFKVIEVKEVPDSFVDMLDEALDHSSIDKIMANTERNRLINFFSAR